MTQPDHARRACAARAGDGGGARTPSGSSSPRADGRELDMGVGINTGQHDRRGTWDPATASPTPPVGDPVNVASRIEGLSKEYGVRDRDRRGHPAGGGRCLRVPLPRPGGREGPRRAPPGLRAARAPPAPIPPERREALARYDSGVALYRNRAPGPRPRRSSRSSPPRRRTTAPWPSTDDGRRALLDEPPARDWDGVWVAQDEVARYRRSVAAASRGESSTKPGVGPSTRPRR